MIDPDGLLGRGAGKGPYPPGEGPGSGNITITTRGVCDGQPGNCAAAMQAAGVAKPYYGSTKKYDLICLASLGIGVKAGGVVAGNALANQVPKGAAALGATSGTMSVITRGVAIFTSPATTLFSLGVVTPSVLEHCEMKPPQTCTKD